MTKDEALKLALEALECLKRDFDAADVEWEIADQAITAIKEALAQPEQEPVAWMFQHEETGRMSYVSNDGLNNPTTFVEMNPRYALICFLYTTPPQRTWVGLSDVNAIELWQLARHDIVEFARVIEAKLKESNTSLS
jgi:hypothetical protein